MQDAKNPYQAPSVSGGPAQNQQALKTKMMGPGISLLIVGGLGLISMGGYFILSLVGMALDPDLSAPPAGASDAEQTGFYFGLYGSLIIMALSALLQIVVILGGVNFLRQKGRTMAIAACIVSLIPCMSSCCVFGMPFGIWRLVVLAAPDVKRAMG